MKHLRRILVVSAALLVVAIAALIFAARRGTMKAADVELVMTSMLVIASFVYASVSLIAIRDNRETSVRPILVLDIRSAGEQNPAAVMRVLNCGRGPALDVSFKFRHEPSEPSFSLANLKAVRAGLSTLPHDEERFYSTGQPYEAVAAAQEPYEVEVSYKSIHGTRYREIFVLLPQPDRHLFR